jgi:hypothetical protein
MSDVAPADWKWFGNAGHFICGSQCRFHLTTLVGAYLVSTVGQYLPDSSTREILAQCRGIELKGRGDAREADWMEKAGFEEIGCGRKFETMVFKALKPCDSADCGCGLPEINGTELEFRGYNDARAATAGHMELCALVATAAFQQDPAKAEARQ